MKSTGKILLLTIVMCWPILALGQPKIVTQHWTGLSQGKDLPSFHSPKKFKVTAFAQIQTLDKNATAFLFAQVYYPQGEPEFIYTTIKSSDATQWQSYSLDGVMKKDAKGLLLGALVEYNGEFHFDDFVLSVENEKGVMENVPLLNSNFESTASDRNKIVGWNEGIFKDQPIRVNGFTIGVSADVTKESNVMTIEGKEIKNDSSMFIKPLAGYTPQVGALVAMLNNLSQRVEKQLSSMSQQDIDFLLDDKANSIGALIMHLAAAEAYYQVLTFENREFNDEEQKKWKVAMELGEPARKSFKGKDVSFYLNEYKAVRNKTLEELKKRNDDWLLQDLGGFPGANNYYGWFHVMEHQSSHLGQAQMLKKRIQKKEMKTSLHLEN
ncbi:MAG: hypothetical protein DI538_07720 [Azospira oryzae]|nr:MAG: hypothetical protein DI538_07720 [Azospira oryzae]